MSNDVDGAGPAEAIVRLRRSGLANSPTDCAEQLAAVADAMMAVASGMSWVAQYGDDVEPEMRAALSAHAAELDGASRMAQKWANAIVAA
jgi:hypothetical protein